MTRKQKIVRWEKILKRQVASGKSLSGFCRDEQINYKTALRWRDVIDATASSSSECPQVNFIEIPQAVASHVPAGRPARWRHSRSKSKSSNQSSSSLLELEFPGRLILKIPPGFDPKTFSQVVELLREEI